MDYEDASGEKVSDNTMRSAIMSYSPMELQLHLQVTASSVKKRRRHHRKCRDSFIR